MNITLIIKKMALSLKQNKIIAVDTDTIPGFMINTSSEIASQILFATKNRPTNKKLILMSHDWNLLKEIIDLSELEQKWLEKILINYWPGRYTFIFKVKANQQKRYGKTIGVRIPSNFFLLKFLQFYGKPVYLTSINKSGDLPFLKIEKKIKNRFPRVSLWVDNRERVYRTPSKIIDLTEGELKVVRN